MLVSPSILSADFSQLSKEIKSICATSCDFVHIDVMDGHFVPNLTIGPLVLESIQGILKKPLDIHLMVDSADFFIDLFASLKPDIISFHIEKEHHPHRLIQKLKSLNIKASIALNPSTHESSIEYLIEDLDMVLVMSVNPGFGGQKFLPFVLDKIKKIKKLIEKKNSSAIIEVDGGVNDINIKQLKKAGADIVVAGSYIFNSKNYSRAVESLKKDLP